MELGIKSQAYKSIIQQVFQMREWELSYTNIPLIHPKFIDNFITKFDNRSNTSCDQIVFGNWERSHTA